MAREVALTLDALIDALIPAREDGRVEAPSTLGLAGYVVEKFGEAAPMLEQGLIALAEFAAQRGVVFNELATPERVALLRAYDAEAPGLVPGIVFQLYQGYYQHPRVVEALGLEARPPYPKGYELEDGDLSLLEAVRNRGQRYREA